MPDCPNALVRKTSSYCFLLLLAARVPVPFAQAQEANGDGTIEEVVVTGSYIGSTAVDKASPVEIISSEIYSLPPKSHGPGPWEK